MKQKPPARLILQSRNTTTTEPTHGSTVSLHSTASSESSIRSLFTLADESGPGRGRLRRPIILDNGRPFLNPKATHLYIWDVMVMMAVLYFTVIPFSC